MAVYIKSLEEWGEVISYLDEDTLIVRRNADPWFPITVDATDIQQRPN